MIKSKGPKEVKKLFLNETGTQMDEQQIKLVTSVYAEMSCPVMLKVAQNWHYYMSLDVQSYNHEIGEMLIESIDESRLQESGLEPIDFIRIGLKSFNRIYKDFYDGSLDISIESEKQMFNKNLKKNEKE